MARKRDNARLNKRVKQYAEEYNWWCPRGWWRINRWINERDLIKLTDLKNDGTMVHGRRTG